MAIFKQSPPLTEETSKGCDKRCNKSVLLVKLLKFSEHQFPLASKPPAFSVCMLCVAEPVDSVTAKHQIDHRLVSLAVFLRRPTVLCIHIKHFKIFPRCDLQSHTWLATADHFEPHHAPQALCFLRSIHPGFPSVPWGHCALPIPWAVLCMLRPLSGMVFLL